MDRRHGDRQRPGDARHRGAPAHRWRASRESIPGLLLWLGTVAYAVCNYAFYLFGAGATLALCTGRTLALCTGAAAALLLAHADRAAEPG